MAGRAPNINKQSSSSKKKSPVKDINKSPKGVKKHAKESNESNAPNLEASSSSQGNVQGEANQFPMGKGWAWPILGVTDHDKKLYEDKKEKLKEGIKEAKGVVKEAEDLGIDPGLNYDVEEMKRQIESLEAEYNGGIDYEKVKGKDSPLDKSLKKLETLKGKIQEEIKTKEDEVKEAEDAKKAQEAQEAEEAEKAERKKKEKEKKEKKEKKKAEQKEREEAAKKAREAREAREAKEAQEAEERKAKQKIDQANRERAQQKKRAKAEQMEEERQKKISALKEKFMKEAMTQLKDKFGDISSNDLDSLIGEKIEEVIDKLVESQDENFGELIKLAEEKLSRSKEIEEIMASEKFKELTHKQKKDVQDRALLLDFNDEQIKKQLNDELKKRRPIPSSSSSSRPRPLIASGADPDARKKQQEQDRQKEKDRQEALKGDRANAKNELEKNLPGITIDYNTSALGGDSTGAIFAESGGASYHATRLGVGNVASIGMGTEIYDPSKGTDKSLDKLGSSVYKDKVMNVGADTVITLNDGKKIPIQTKRIENGTKTNFKTFAKEGLNQLFGLTAESGKVFKSNGESAEIPPYTKGNATGVLDLAVDDNTRGNVGSMDTVIDELVDEFKTNFNQANNVFSGVHDTINIEVRVRNTGWKTAGATEYKRSYSIDVKTLGQKV